MLERTKGGLMVDVGVPAFMPGSQVDIRPMHDLDQFLGQDIPVKVLKINRRRGNVVVSRKLAIEEELKARKATRDGTFYLKARWSREPSRTLPNTAHSSIWAALTACCMSATCRTAASTHPSEVVHVGDEITVKILKFDKREGAHFARPAPAFAGSMGNAAAPLPPGSRVVGRVMSITDYGAFVEIEPGVEGLIHISEMTWSRRMKHPGKVVKVGDQVEAVVLEVKSRDRRVSLGIKQLEADPWTTVGERYSIGSRGRRPGAKIDRFRRVSGDRGRRRRPGSRLRSFLDQACQASFGAA